MMNAPEIFKNNQTPSIDIMMNDIEKMQLMAKKLVQTKHYQKLGEEGIFAIGMMARSMGMSELEALNGEMYYVQGRVGMAAEAMNKRIRMAGHSVTLKHLDFKGCTLIGKRCDTGDTAEISYTIEDAKSAGKTYQKNEKDMYFARALSRLKRILFPDIGTKLYTKEELDDITEDTQISDVKPLCIEEKKISTEQAIELGTLLAACSPKVQENFALYFRDKYKITILDELPETAFEMQKKALVIRSEEYQKQLAEAEMSKIISLTQDPVEEVTDERT